MKLNSVGFYFLLLVTFFTACKKDNNDLPPEPEIPKPTIEKLELGLGNSGIGVVDEDFHFEADLLAADKLDTVKVNIRQRAGETYSKAWSHEITWTQYKGLKNTNVHKHFNIPADAAEGKYDLLITVQDENGATLEEKRDFEIYKRANLPVRPIFSGIFFHKNWQFIYDLHADGDNYPSERFKQGDSLSMQVNISFVKGDGKLYMLLIKKSASYNPETIEEVDLNKAIVYDVFEHKNEPAIYDFGNFVFDMETFTVVRDFPFLVIGADKDYNTPTPNAISGSKAWESGEYNLVLIYKNITENKTIHQSIPFGIDYN